MEMNSITPPRELAEIRHALDEVDVQLVALFEKRMQLCREVAEYKLAHQMQVLDRSREEQVLASRAAMLTDEGLEEAVKELYRTLMALSREEQQKLIARA